jgi:hypothetical protein
VGLIPIALVLKNADGISRIDLALAKKRYSVSWRDVAIMDENPGFDKWKKINLAAGVFGLIMLIVGLLTGKLTMV